MATTISPQSHRQTAPGSAGPAAPQNLTIQTCDAQLSTPENGCWVSGKPGSTSPADAEKLVGRVAEKRSNATASPEQQRRIVDADQLANSVDNAEALTPIFEQSLSQMKLPGVASSKAADIKQELRAAWKDADSSPNVAFANRVREQLLKFAQDQRMVPSVVAAAVDALYVAQEDAHGNKAQVFDRLAPLVLLPALREAPEGQFSKLQDQQESRIALWNEATATNIDPVKRQQGYAVINRSQLFSSNSVGINDFEHSKDVLMGFVSAMAEHLNLRESPIVGTQAEKEALFTAYVQEGLRDLKEGLPLIQKKGIGATFGQNTDDGIMMNDLGPQIHNVLKQAEWSGGINKYIQLSTDRKNTENPVASASMLLDAAGIMMAPLTSGASLGVLAVKPVLSKVDEAFTLKVKSQAGTYEQRMLEAMRAARAARQ